MKKLFATIVEWIKLFTLNLVVKKRNFFEFLKVVKRYYFNSRFRKIDLCLLLKYVFKDPFTISKSFMQSKGESDVYVYGETPLTSWEQIAKECEISEADKLFELGCGRGRGCFWLTEFIGCHVVGIEYIPEFIGKAQLVKSHYGVDKVEFRTQDFFKADLKGATVIYLYGTCMDAVSIKKLIKKMARLPIGTKIITVSYSLSEFSDKPLFETLKRFRVPYTWGTAEVYLQHILPPNPCP